MDRDDNGSATERELANIQERLADLEGRVIRFEEILEPEPYPGADEFVLEVIEEDVCDD